jgi:glycosyltransferase involved in cell wall biosynthesis
LRKNLSIIITAHSEGVIAHKTMLSVFRATKVLDIHNVSYEILVHLDSPDEATVEYFSRYNNSKTVRLFTNQFGDLSESRNFTISKATGKYVTTLDSDDLISENWYYTAYQVIKSRPNSMIHPNYIIAFGDKKIVTTKVEDFVADRDLLRLIDGHWFSSVVFGKKEIFLSHPYIPNRNGFSAEDKSFNLNTLSDGINHVVAPKTALFYRKNIAGRISLLDSQNMNWTTIAPTPAFDFNKLHKVNVSDSIIIPAKNTMRRFCDATLYYIIQAARHFSVYHNIHGRFIEPKRATKFPAWLIDEWKKINKVEKLLWPEYWDLTHAIWWEPSPIPGLCYLNFIKQLNKKPDTIFMVPWLSQGGADKVFIRTSNELSRSHSDWKLALVATLPHNNPWKDDLSNDIGFTDWHAAMQGLDSETQYRLMALFVVQNNIKRIIIGNSRFAYDFVLRYKRLLRALDVKIYVFAFAGATAPDGRIGGYVHEFLPLIYDVTYRIITDNSVIVKDLLDQDGFNSKKIFIHHQYIDSKLKIRKTSTGKILRILWASRVAKSKLPEILVQIAEKLDPEKYAIDVYGVIEDDYTEKIFQNIPGLRYVRPYNGIDDLPTDKYDVFLYTSESDGLPNVLLEIASKNLPIIAPNIGGISDLIENDKTGVLINRPDDIEGYVKGIKKLADLKIRKKLVANMSKILEADFSKTRWRSNLKKIFDK